MEVSILRKRLNALIEERKALFAQIKSEGDALLIAKQRIEDVKDAQVISQIVAQKIQHSAHKQVAKLVSKCLSSVFEKPYELRIELDRKRGRTEAKFLYYREGRKINPRLTSGGVLHVAALALRLTSLMLDQPAATRLLNLDEPFQGLDSLNLQKMATLISTLNKELKVQFIIVTHDEALEIEKVIRLPIVPPVVN